MAASHAHDVELVDGIVLVPGSVNGLEGHFALDTGATETVLNATYCDGARGGEGEPALTFDSSVQSSATLTADEASISFCDEVHELRGATLIDMGYVETPLRAVKSDLRLLGSIGTDLIGRGRLLIDYVHASIVLDAAPFPEGARKVPLYAELLPVVELSLQDQSFRFVLDTGANGFVMDRSVAPMDQLAAPTERDGLYVIPSLSFAGMEYQDVSGMVADLSAVREAVPVDGIIGYQLLRDQVCGFDFDEGQLYLWNGDVASLPSPGLARRSQAAV